MTATADGRLGITAQFALLAGPLLSMLDSSIVNVAIAPIAAELNSDLVTVQWVTSGYMLALGTGLALTSYLARRFGTLRTYTTGVLAFTVASALCAFAPSIELLIGARIVQGVTGATLVPLAMSMLLGGGGASRDISPLAGMLLFLGPALGPTLGGLLIGAFGWRSIFVINLPVGLLATLAVRAVPARIAPPRRPDAHLDALGLVLLAVGLFGVLFGLDRGNSQGWNEPDSWLPLGVGALLLLAYVLHARRAPHPALDLAILRDRGAALSFALCAAASVAAWSILFLLPVFLQQVQGHSAVTAGIALLPQGILTGLGTVLGQKVADRIGVRWTVVLGFAVLLASSLGLLAIGLDTSIWLTAAILAARSASIGLVITPLLTVVNLHLRPDQQADANTVFNVVQRIAGSLGIGLLVGLFTTHSAAAGPVDALHEIAVVIAVLSGLAAAAAVWLPRSGRRL
ncbi:DHA2 family efflux MFS transporter permease subunit [Microbacterium luticocti]|uniref:DHA2 family efflux MFS transporter permease subunit n=1 Tax=Microbacterium luticocti TaxID=451764 RepID=UPI00048AF796|nr:DHA2 family efflux MFS transporter permease subunit [Microbacterium luticocti]